MLLEAVHVGLGVVEVLQGRDGGVRLVCAHLPQLGYLGGGRGEHAGRRLVAADSAPHGLLCFAHGALDKDSMTLQVLVQLRFA